MLKLPSRAWVNRKTGAQTIMSIREWPINERRSLEEGEGQEAGPQRKRSNFLNLFLFYFFLTADFFFLSLFIYFERERAQEQGRDREGGGERESPKQALCCQHRAQCEAQSHEL